MEIRNEEMIVKGLKGLERAEYRRKAGRTDEQFASDIEKGHKYQKEIMMRYDKYYKETFGENLKITDNGVDNSGKVIPIEDVTDDADYLVNDKPFEIKYIEKKLFTFRLKLNLLKSYIKQDANMLIVIGWETESPEFTILNAEQIKHIVKYSQKIVSGDWEGKPTVRVYRNSFEWTKLPL